MNKPKPAQTGSFWRSIKTVSWSFVGLRERGEADKEAERINPVHIVVAGLIGVLVFVGGLILLVTWVVGA